MLNFVGGSNFNHDFFFAQVNKVPEKGSVKTDFWYAEDFKKDNKTYKRVVFYDTITNKMYSTIDFNAYRMFEAATRCKIASLTFDFKKIS